MNKDHKQRLLDKLQDLNFQMIGVQTVIHNKSTEEGLTDPAGRCIIESQTVMPLFMRWRTCIEKSESVINKLQPFAKADQTLRDHLSSLTQQIQDQKSFINNAVLSMAVKPFSSQASSH
jgi:hypothetical protein